MFYIVSSPIGNSKDISFRAIEILKNVQFILCEDTRITGKLLTEFNIKAKLLMLNDHNESSMIKDILSMLEDKKDLALMSDAGAPLINDPGFRIVREVIKANHQLTAIPGPSSLIAAIQLAGISAHEFCFLGFFPRKRNQQRAFIDKIKDNGMTAIFFESAKRFKNSLKVLKDFIHEDADITVARELTKKHESLYRGQLKEISESNFIPESELKGEITVVLKILDSKKDIDLTLQEELLSFLSKGDAAKVLSKIYKVPKREIYKKFPK